jgi:ParB-like chromosome segregation protein Spo0J
MAKVRILEELKTLVPPLSAGERDGLRESIQKCGIEVPVTVWQTPEQDFVLLDGHNRYAISKELGIHCPIGKVKSAKEIPDLEAAALWVLANQSFRRNLNDAQRIRLAAEYANRLSEQSRRIANMHRKAEIQEPGGEIDLPVDKCETAGRQANTELEAPLSPRAQAAEQYGVSEYSIRKEQNVIKAEEEREEQMASVAPSLSVADRRAAALDKVIKGQAGSVSSFDSDYQKQHLVQAYLSQREDAKKLINALSEKGLGRSKKADLKKKLGDLKSDLERRWSQLQGMGVSEAQVHGPQLDESKIIDEPKTGVKGTEWVVALIRSLEQTKRTYDSKLKKITPTEHISLAGEEKEQLKLAARLLVQVLDQIQDL